MANLVSTAKYCIMTPKEIEHLAHLSRISLTDAEKTTLSDQIADILAYVGAITDSTSKETSPAVPALYNVLREDTEPHEGGRYSQALLEAAPSRNKQHIAVKNVFDTADTP